MSNEFRTGYLAVVGRPNVGKSTLVNRMVGARVSITSKKAQTTRHRIHGVLTSDTCQYIFVDTPGFQTKHKNALNRMMNRSVSQSLVDVDVVLFVIEAGRWGEGEQALLPQLPVERPVLLVINKIDRFADKTALLPFIQKVAAHFPFTEIVPLSAESGSGIDALFKELGITVVPAQEQDEDQNRSSDDSDSASDSASDSGSREHGNHERQSELVHT